MSASTVVSPGSAPSVMQRCIGVVLGAIVLFALFSSGSDMAEGRAMFSWLAVGAGALLMVSARKNSPLLWNMFGRLMRRLLGEGAARAYFFLAGLVFSVTGVAALLG